MQHGFGQAVLVSKDTPIYSRLAQLLGRTNSMAAHIAAFEQRLNGGNADSPSNTTGAKPPQPSMSIEQIVSEIEGCLADIDSTHGRLAARF